MKNLIPIIINIVSGILYITMILLMYKKIRKYKKGYENAYNVITDNQKKHELETKHKDEYISNLRYYNKEIEKLYYQLLNAKTIKQKICKTE